MSPTTATLGLLLFLLFPCVPGRPLAPSAGKSLQVGQGGPHRRTLLEASATVPKASSSKQQSYLEGLVHAFSQDYVVPAAAEAVTHLLGLGQEANATVAAALHQVNEALLPPLLDSVLARDEELGSLVGNTSASHDDLLELVRDPDFITKLFSLVSQVLTERVPEAQQVVYQVLTGSLGNATELSGSGTASNSQGTAMVEDAMELFDRGVALLHDEAGFKQAMESILAALGQEGA